MLRLWKFIQSAKVIFTVLLINTVAIYTIKHSLYEFVSSDDQNSTSSANKKSCNNIFSIQENKLSNSGAGIVSTIIWNLRSSRNLFLKEMYYEYLARYIPSSYEIVENADEENKPVFRKKVCIVFS